MKLPFQNGLSKQNFFFCPLPEEQKPIKEYINAKKNLLITKIIEKNFFSKFYNFYIIILFLCLSEFFLSKNILNNFSLILLEKYLKKFIFFVIISTFIFYLLALNRWLEINSHFNQSSIFYEEGSWYDCQNWEKPLIIIKNDKLIKNQKIKKIIKKILFFLKILLVLWISINIDL